VELEEVGLAPAAVTEATAVETVMAAQRTVRQILGVVEEVEAPTPMVALVDRVF
jgi:hypothetical protein